MKRILLTLIITIAASHIVQAADQATSWKDLSPEVKKVLKRFESNWEALPQTKQNKLLVGANRWLTMTPEQRKTSGERFKKWSKLSNEQKNLLSDRFSRFRELPPATQQKLRAKFAQFKKLTPKERRRLRDRFNKLSPEKRRNLIKRMKKRRAARRRH